MKIDMFILIAFGIKLDDFFLSLLIKFFGANDQNEGTTECSMCVPVRKKRHSKSFSDIFKLNKFQFVFTVWNQCDFLFFYFPLQLNTKFTFYAIHTTNTPNRIRVLFQLHSLTAAHTHLNKLDWRNQKFIYVFSLVLLILSVNCRNSFFVSKEYTAIHKSNNTFYCCCCSLNLKCIVCSSRVVFSCCFDCVCVFHRFCRFSSKQICVLFYSCFMWYVLLLYLFFGKIKIKKNELNLFGLNCLHINNLAPRCENCNSFFLLSLKIDRILVSFVNI